MGLILKVDNCSFGYKKTKMILNDISFEVKEKEVLSILGPNGVGKTTLLKCMMNMQKWSKGSTKLDNEKIEDLSPKEIWKKIAYVPQAKNTVQPYTAEEMILLGRSTHISLFSQPSSEDMDVVYKVMEEVGISYLRGKLCSQMSGGELQMVLIARALATNPKLLVLDEPESNLDFKNQLIILEIIEKLSKESGISCIFNTHYPAHALKVSSHGLVLKRDGVSIFGECKDVITEDIMRDTFGVNVHIDDVFIDQEEYKSVIPLSIVL